MNKSPNSFNDNSDSQLLQSCTGQIAVFVNTQPQNGFLNENLV